VRCALCRKRRPSIEIDRVNKPNIIGHTCVIELDNVTTNLVNEWQQTHSVQYSIADCLQRQTSLLCVQGSVQVRFDSRRQVADHD
jgi:hypothetical protein